MSTPGSYFTAPCACFANDGDGLYVVTGVQLVG